MDRTTKPALKLNRETVRALTMNEMTQVAGGALLLAPVNCITKTCPTITKLGCFPVKFMA